MGTHAPIWRATAPLFAAAFLAYGYNNAFMTLLPTFVQDIGGSPFEGGLQGSVFLIAAVLMRFYFGPLADRIGTKPVMALGIGAFVAGAFILTVYTAFWQVLCVRCIQAVGLAAFYPCATAFTADAAPTGRSGFFLGLYRFVTSASLLLGPSVAFALADIGGYRASFAALGACALVALALVAVLPAEPRCPEIKRPSAAKAPRPGIAAVVRTALTADPRTLALVLGSTFVAALGYGLLFTFGATFVGSIDPTANAGLYFTLIGVGGLVANPLVGWLADRMGHNRLLVCCMVATAVGVGLLGIYGYWETAGPSGAAVLVASGLCAGAGYAGVMTCAIAIVATALAPQARSSALALQQNAIDLGIACAGLLFGAIIAAAGSNTAIVFMAQGVLMLGCTALGAMTLGRQHIKGDPRSTRGPLP